MILFWESGTFIRARGDTLSSQGDNVLPSDSRNQKLCNFDRNLPVHLLIYRYVLLFVILYYLSRLDFFHLFSCELALSCRVLTFLTGRQNATGSGPGTQKICGKVYQGHEL